MNDRLLIVFTKNLIEGKVKTRLANSIGASSALKVYSLLLDHTKNILKDLDVNMRVGYSDFIDENDGWKAPPILKFVQSGSELGDRMKNAFSEGFNDGYGKIVLIGGDCFNLEGHHIITAFEALEKNQFVFGPALDGGYYLIGMTVLNEQIFRNKQWGTNTVLESTLKDLEDETVFLLEPLNDIDTLEDLEGCSALLNRINSNDKIH